MKPEVLKSRSLEIDYSRAPCLGTEKRHVGSGNEIGKDISTEYNGISTEYDGISTEYNGISTEYNGISTEYNGISTEYNGIRTEYDGISTEYNELITEYNNITTKYNDKTTQYNRNKYHKTVLAFHTRPLLNSLERLMTFTADGKRQRLSLIFYSFLVIFI